VEASGFGEKWRHRLASIDEVLERRRELEGKVHLTYYVLIASVLVSAAALTVPGGYRFPSTSSYTSPASAGGSSSGRSCG
jgi:hypothetical protein